MGINLEFERPLAGLREQLEGLDRELAAHPSDELRARREALAGELQQQAAEIYAELNRWQKVQVARYQRRPQTLDYAKAIFTDFVELARRPHLRGPAKPSSGARPASTGRW